MGQSCISPRIETSLPNLYRLPLPHQGLAMNFSAAKASRKWPCRGGGCDRRPMVTGGALSLALFLALLTGSPCAEARSLALRGGFFTDAGHAKRQTAVPLPKP